MADVFDEIEDDLRQEKLKAFWRENGSWIIGSAIAAVVMTAALVFWRDWNVAQDEKATSALFRAVESKDVAVVGAFSAEARTNHAVLAHFAAARLALDTGDTAKAITLYAEISKTRGIDRTYRDLAKILELTERLSTDDPALLQKEIADLASDKNAFRHSARELQGLLAARQGDLERAANVMAELSGDASAPEDLRRRAFTLYELYAAETKK